MKRRSHWLWTLTLLAAIWSGVAVVMSLTADLVSTPAKVLELVQAAPWLENKDLPYEQRQHYLDQVITKQNLLDFKQRRDLREEGQPMLDSFFRSLSAEEKKEYANRTTVEHLKAVSKGLQAMPAGERKQMATRIRRDMIARAGDTENVPSMEEFEMMFELGLDTFLKDASADEKMRLAPVIEDMQARIQGLRR